MSAYSISGDLALEEIEAAIQSLEVTRNKFIGAVIAHGDNQCDFVRQRVPPRPHLVFAGDPSPPGTSLGWSGTLRVSGEDRAVELFRRPDAAAP